MARMTISTAVRNHCLKCCGGDAVEVEMCTAPNCDLYKYRLGKEGVTDGGNDKSSVLPEEQAPGRKRNKK